MNKNYGKIVNGEIEYADDTAAVWDNVLYRPVPGSILELMGYKRIVRSVPQYPPQERHTWAKTPDEGETTIFYRWHEEPMTDAEYYVWCQDQLKESDWITGAHAEKRMSDAKYKEWCDKRYSWWLFVHNYEGQ